MTEFVYGKIWASQGHTEFHEDAKERKTVAASKDFCKSESCCEPDIKANLFFLVKLFLV